MKGNFLAIDGSLLAFRAAAAGEKRSLLVKHLPTKAMKEFEGRNAFKSWLKTTNEKREDEGKDPFDITEFEVEDLLEAPEEAVSIHIANEMIKEMLSRTKSNDYVVYLDKGLTFRHKLATVQEYKGNRKDQIKPVNLDLVKEHLILHCNGKVVTGLEADDYLNFHQWEGYISHRKGKKGKIIAATFDKDAYGNSGWVYDFRKEDNGKPKMAEPVLIRGLGELWIDDKGIVRGKGRKWFWYQVLAGDTTDNYKPNKLSKQKYGEKAAYKDIAELDNEKDVVRAVVARYKAWYPEPVHYTSWDGREMVKSWEELLQEYFDLARMRRWENDVVDVKNVIAATGE